VVESVVQASVDKVSVSVLEGGSVDKIEVVKSVEVLNPDISVETSVVKSVDVEKSSDTEVSVVEPEVEISDEEVSVIVLDEKSLEVENSIEVVSATVLEEGSVEE
jgi:sulfur relay (sulfurtransferase) DsrF/TusC family protein